MFSSRLTSAWSFLRPLLGLAGFRPPSEATPYAPKFEFAQVGHFPQPKMSHTADVRLTPSTVISTSGRAFGSIHLPPSTLPGRGENPLSSLQTPRPFFLFFIFYDCR
jgi:hypothetical protein